MATHTWRAETYAENARFVAELGGPLLEMLAPQQSEDILDLGCGDGALTIKLVDSGARVVGVDASASMVEAACALGLDARLIDGHALNFDHQFDAVVSNAALHWMTRPDDVLAGVVRALRPGGRFVAEFGGHGNVAAITVALLATVRRFHAGRNVRSPWYFPTAENYAAKLKRHGFVVESIAIVPRPTLLPKGMEGWLETFAWPFFTALDPEERRTAIAEAVTLLREVLCDANSKWIADYVRLRVAARLPQ